MKEMTASELRESNERYMRDMTAKKEHGPVAAEKGYVLIGDNKVHFEWPDGAKAVRIFYNGSKDSITVSCPDGVRSALEHSEACECALCCDEEESDYDEEADGEDPFEGRTEVRYPFSNEMLMILMTSAAPPEIQAEASAELLRRLVEHRNEKR